MNHEEHDELWELLGKAREPKVPPFFTGKVMRALQEERERPAGLFAWLRVKWFVPAAVTACATVVAFIMLRDEPPGVPKLATADPIAEIAKVAAQDDDIEASIDTLLAAEDNSVWLSADPSAFLP